MKETKLKCTNGWVKIRKTIDKKTGKDIVILSTDMDNEDGEVKLELSYDSEELALKVFKKVSSEDPDKIKATILNMIEDN